MPLLSYSKIPGAQGMFALLQNVKKKKKSHNKRAYLYTLLGFQKHKLSSAGIRTQQQLPPAHTRHEGLLL